MEISTSVIVKEHLDIKKNFVDKIQFLLSGENKIKKYSVEEEYNGEVEQLQLDNEHYEITIRCRCKK